MRKPDMSEQPDCAQPIGAFISLAVLLLGTLVAIWWPW